jgi:hypothetical protein
MSSVVMIFNEASCQPPNKQLQRTVMDKVPSHMRQRVAAELRRYEAGTVPCISI